MFLVIYPENSMYPAKFYVCVSMYVCVCVSMYMCVCVSMYVWVCVSMYVCEYVVS